MEELGRPKDGTWAGARGSGQVTWAQDLGRGPGQVQHTGDLSAGCGQVPASLRLGFRLLKADKSGAVFTRLRTQETSAR